jgi:hypothetical protein
MRGDKNMKEIKYYLLLKDGTKKYFDWTCGGFREAQRYVLDNIEKVVIKENGDYTLYTEEV